MWLPGRCSFEFPFPVFRLFRALPYFSLPLGALRYPLVLCRCPSGRFVYLRTSSLPFGIPRYLSYFFVTLWPSSLPFGTLRSLTELFLALRNFSLPFAAFRYPMAPFDTLRNSSLLFGAVPLVSDFLRSAVLSGCGSEVPGTLHGRLAWS